MGSRGNYAHREKRKSRKDSKKIAPISVTSSPVEVEVIRKKRKPREEEEE
ncbi:MAG: hypothetical protein JXA17_00190 [Dehalococcoidales bacterium]|nr:hypothetical protein [Dehalococcoidales bacterium]